MYYLRERIVYFASLLISLTCFLMFGITFSGVIFIILLLYGLLSVLVVSFTGRNLFISLKTKEEGLREEKMPIEIIIKNKSSLPVFRSDINIKCKNLLGGEEFEKTINKGILPGGISGGERTEELIVDATCNHYGMLECKISSVRIADPLGIISRELANETKQIESSPKYTLIMPLIDTLDINSNTFEY